MNVFDVISLLGGLAMFLYGMRLMGDSLKENSSGALKRAMEKVTNSHFKAFILGMLVTALIQSVSPRSSFHTAKRSPVNPTSVTNTSNFSHQKSPLIRGDFLLSFVFFF